MFIQHLLEIYGVIEILFYITRKLIEDNLHVFHKYIANEIQRDE